MGDLSGWLHDVPLRSQIMNYALECVIHCTLSVNDTPHNPSETTLRLSTARFGAVPFINP
jgi:hypothetical protein